MANTLLTNDIIAKASLPALKNNLKFAKMVDRQYQNVFSNRTGDTIRIFEPMYYNVRTGDTIATQDITQRTVPLTISYKDGVDMAITSTQLALSLDSFTKTVLEPAMRQLANKVDQRLYNLATQVYNAVGTPGSPPNSYASINNARALLDSFGVEEMNRYCLLQSYDAAALRNGAFNYFNEAWNKDIIVKGVLGEMAGFDIYSVQNVIRPAYGSLPIGGIGTPLVNGASQTGSSLITDGWTASTANILNVGATFTIAGVYALNPMSQTTTGALQTFTVTADANSSGGGNSTLQISPAIITTGPYGTVTNSPADNAVITVNNTHNINLAFNEKAFTLAMINLNADGNGAYQRNMVDADAGIAIRMSRQYDITNDRDVIRFDILYGMTCFPAYVTRIMGS